MRGSGARRLRRGASLATTPTRDIVGRLGRVGIVGIGIVGIGGLVGIRAEGIDTSPGEATLEFEDDSGRLVEGDHIRVPVDTRGTYRIRYRVGENGLRVGAEIELVRQSPWDIRLGTALQSVDSGGAGHVSASTSRPGARARVVGLPSSIQDTRMIRLRIEGVPLEGGDGVLAVIGDRSSGGSGIVTGPVAHRSRAIHLRVAAAPQARLETLPRPLRVDLVPGDVSRYALVVPSEVGRGESLSLTVRAQDRNSNIRHDHRRQVRLVVETELDGEIVPRAAAESIELPDRIDFEAEGVLRVRGRAAGVGVFWIAAEDDRGRRGRSNPVRVTSGAPTTRLWWGDLHVHTLASDGSDTPAENLVFARDTAGLDFVALTDHLHPDGSDTALRPDPVLVRAVENGIRSPGDLRSWWDDLRAASDRFHTPGRFVTLHGFEWSGASRIGGDHNVYLSGGIELPALARLDDLYDRLEELDRADNVAILPHVGGRAGNLDFHRPGIETALEICSAHGRFEWFAQDALGRGHRLAFTGGGASHHGRPGHTVWQRFGRMGLRPRAFGLPGGLTAIRAGSLGRADLLRALRRRRMYATSGARILVDFRVDDRSMGEMFTALDPPRLRFTVYGTDRVERVDVIRDRSRLATFRGARRVLSGELVDHALTPGPHYYYLRVTQVDGELAWASPVWVTRAGGTTPEDDDTAESLPAWNDDGDPQEWRSVDPSDHAQSSVELDRLLRGRGAGSVDELTPVREVRNPGGSYLLFFGRMDGRPIRVRWWRGFTEPRLHLGPGRGDYGPYEGGDGSES